MITELSAVVTALRTMTIDAKIKNKRNFLIIANKVLGSPIPSTFTKDDCPAIGIFKGLSVSPKPDNDQDAIQFPAEHQIYVDFIDYSMTDYGIATEYTDDLMEKWITEFKKDPTVGGKINDPKIEITPDYAEDKGGGWYSVPRLTISFSLYIT